MPEQEDFTFKKEKYDLDQIVDIDPEKLKVVKINNVSGRTRIVGTNEPRIRLHAKGEAIFGFGYPNIEVSKDGKEVEIDIIPGKSINIALGKKFNIQVDGLDPDIAYNWPNDNYDLGEKPQRWSYPNYDDYEQALDEWRDRKDAMKEEMRRAREEAKEAAREARERVRERAEQEREKAEQMREQIQEARKYGRFKFDFNPEFLSGFAEGLGETLQSILSSSSELVIEVPNWVEIEAKTTSGGLDIANISGFCRIKSSSGGMRLEKLTGGVQIKGLSGKVEAYGLVGRVTAKLVSGGVQLRDSRLSALDLSTTSGNITVETALAEVEEGEYRINNVSGSIKLFLPGDTRATMECRTLSGRIRVTPEISTFETRNRPGQSQSKIDLNGGGRKMILTTVSGKIEVDLYTPGQPRATESRWPSDSAWPKPPTPPEPPRAPEPPEPPTPPSFFSPLVTPVPAKMYVDEERKIVMNEQKPEVKEAPSPVQESAPEPPKRSRQLEILQSIERGEISVEEGLAMLSEVDGREQNALG